MISNKTFGYFSFVNYIKAYNFNCKIIVAKTT